MSDPTPIEIARRLIRYKTINPPGSERDAQTFLQALFEKSGYTVQRFECTPERPNLVIRLPGKGLREPLLFYGHMDVVGVDGQQWDIDSFQGIVQDGLLYGRGALDMKAGLAMLTHAMIRARRNNLKPAGDIILAVVVDEESGGAAGMQYLLDEHRDQFERVKYAIGEFGGFPLHVFGRKFYRIGVSQKQYAHLRISLRSRGGHGALPARNTVMYQLGNVLSAIDQSALSYQKTPIAERIITTIGNALPGKEKEILLGLLDEQRFESSLKSIGAGRERFESLFRNTANATIVTAGNKFNVIPAEAAIEVDARLLPGNDTATLVDELHAIVGHDLSIDVVAAGPKTKATVDYALFDTLSGILLELDPEGIPIPYMFSESPDGRSLEAAGMQNYGFLPMNLPLDFDLPSMIHAENESVPLSAIRFGAEAIYRLMELY